MCLYPNCTCFIIPALAFKLWKTSDQFEICAQSLDIFNKIEVSHLHLNIYKKIDINQKMTFFD